MSRPSVHLIHRYAASPARLWDLLTDLGALADLNAPLVRMRGLPSGRIEEGATYRVETSLLGLTPWQRYEMTVVECDPVAMRVRSHEHGAGIHAWCHRFEVRPDGAGAVLEDWVDIDAGWRTPVFRAFARRLYRARHPRRVQMLAC